MPNRSLTFLIGVTVTLTSFISRVSAQELPGKKDSITSAILNQKRFIQVVLPDGYKPGTANKYDVLYVLDGEGNTKTMSDIQQFLSNENYMPKVILVGVLNVDRNKDLTPTREEPFATSGGADKFLAFFKNELIPYINKTYPSDGDNILFGHSFGGLFVTYALLNEPQIFKSYLAADPSYWWGKGNMIREAAVKLPKLANKDKTLFISGREGEGMIGMAILPMDTVLQKSAVPGLTWKIAAYPNETHGSVRLKSIYDGLRFIYDGYQQKGPEIHPMAGIMLKNKPIKIWDFDDLTKVRYTTDGTTPTMASAKIEAINTLNGPGTFTAKAFTGHEKYDKITTGVFKEGNGPSPVKKGKGFKPGGFHYAYYEGTWDKLPDFNKLKPVKEGITDKDFDLTKLPHQANFGVVISGQMEVQEEGYYIFGLSSDDGSRFYFNNQLLLDDDGLHDDNAHKSYILPLKKGFYPIRLEYFQKDGGSSLQLVYLTPAMQNSSHLGPTSIPLEFQYSGD